MKKKYIQIYVHCRLWSDENICHLEIIFYKESLYNIPYVLTFKFIQENAKISPPLGNDRFPPGPSQFFIHLSLCTVLKYRIQDSSVGIEAGYGLDGRGSIPGRDKRPSSTPQRPDRLWGPPSLLSNGYRELFPRG
jgi:hypothetical protein